MHGRQFGFHAQHGAVVLAVRRRVSRIEWVRENLDLSRERLATTLQRDRISARRSLMPRIAGFDVNARNARHRRVTRVPNETVQARLFWKQWFSSWTAVPAPEFIVPFRRKSAHQIAVGVFDLE